MSNQSTVATTGLYLIEYYTPKGENIRFAWVGAATADEAKAKLSNRATDNRGMAIHFGEVINCEEQGRIFPLVLGGDVPRFIDAKA